MTEATALANALSLPVANNATAVYPLADNASGQGVVLLKGPLQEPKCRSRECFRGHPRRGYIS